MKHDALFHWVPSLEEFIGEPVGEATNQNYQQTLHDVCSVAIFHSSHS